MSATCNEYFMSCYVSQHAHEENGCKSVFYLSGSKVFKAGTYKFKNFWTTEIIVAITMKITAF
jgi:hypothetical protein